MSNDLYINLAYEEYKAVERQCRAFVETEHGIGTDYYHKSFRLKIGDMTWEFHGPNVKARAPIVKTKGLTWTLPS